MKQLTKYNTNSLKVFVIEEDVISIIYFSWSVEGEVQTKSVFWIPTHVLDEWLDTDIADKVIKRQIASIDTDKVKEVPVYVEEDLVTTATYTKKTNTYTKGDRCTLQNIKTLETVEVGNVAQFCRERDIPYGSFKKMVRGCNKTSHGWKRVQHDDKSYLLVL